MMSGINYAIPDLWEPWGGNDPGPPGKISLSVKNSL